MKKSKENFHWKQIRGMLHHAVKYVLARSHWDELHDDSDYLFVIDLLQKAHKLTRDKKDRRWDVW